MEKRRTVPVKLDVDSADAAPLRDTVDEFLWAANYVTRRAFEGEHVTTSKTTLNDETSEDVREKTALHSNHSKQLATKPPKPARAWSRSGSKARRLRCLTSPVHTSSTTTAPPRSTTTA